MIARLSTTALVLGAFFAMADRSTAELAAGDDVPKFEMVGSDGKTYSNETLKGKAYVIAWYPKAFTGG